MRCPALDRNSEEERLMKIVRNLGIGASLLSLVACAADVQTSEVSVNGDGDEQSVAVVEQALVNSSVPKSIMFGDATNNGITEWAYTKHGLLFGANLRTTRGTALIENHGNSTLNYSLTLTVSCTAPAQTLSQSWTQQSLAPGQSIAPELRCTQGTGKYARVYVYSMAYSGGENGYTGPASEDNNLLEFRVEDFYVDGVPVTAFAEGAQVTADVKSTSISGTFLNRSNVRLNGSMSVHGRCVDSSGRELDIAANASGFVINPGASISRQVSCPSGYSAWWAFNELSKGWYP
jgi:hypothetical protein